MKVSRTFLALPLLGVGVSASTISLGEGYTVEGNAESFAPASPLEVVDTTAPLHRVDGVNPASSQYMLLLSGAPPGGIRPRFGAAPVHGLFDGTTYYAPVKYAANQNSLAVIDTGSSNIWVTQKGFQCVTDAGKNTTEAACAFGDGLYTISKTFQKLKGVNFNSSYLSGEFLNGIPGKETVTFAGMKVPRQTIGAVNTAYWIGDGHSDGLIGFAYPPLSSLYKGHNYTADKVFGDGRIEYSPLFTTAYLRGTIKPVFSLACPRANKIGVLGFGGIPSEYKHRPFAVTKIQKANILHYGRHEYTFYTITPQGFTFQNAGFAKVEKVDWANPFDGPPAGWKPLDTAASSNSGVVATDFAAIVDSGTSLNFVSAGLAEQINKIYSPPAFKKGKYYFVDCNAVAPKVGIIIDNMELYMDPRDLKIPARNGFCLTGFQPPFFDKKSNQTTPPILGDVFLKNVLAVFDVGAEEMKFTQRYYGE